jgi:hypothetical protein
MKAMTSKKAAGVPVDMVVAAGVKNIHEQSFRFHLKTEGKNNDQYSHRN